MFSQSHVRALPKRLLGAWTRDPWLAASLLGLLCLLVAAAAFASDAGITLDERSLVDYGNGIVAWYRSGFTLRAATKDGILVIYGGLFDLIAQTLARHSPLGVYETRHLLSALAGVLGVVATWKLAAQLGGTRAGFLAALMLAATPAWFGHGLFNPKDIPFGAAAAFYTYACVRIALAQGPLSFRDAGRAGLALGLALGIRSGGMFIASYFLLAVLGALALDTKLAPRGRLLADACLKVVVALALAWAVMLIAWPWAQLAPFTRPFEAAADAAHFGWRGKVLFEGRSISAHHLPASYLPVWFAITLPETYALALLAGVVAAIRSYRTTVLVPRRILAAGILALSALLPLGAVIVERPLIYDAHRHFLFLLPPLAAAAGLALSSYFGSARVPKPLRLLGAALLIGLLALTFIDMRSLHPYEYTYFNRTFGGLPAAAGRFETDYWGASYKEGLAWVVQHPAPGTSAPVRIAWCHRSIPLEYYLRSWHIKRSQFRMVADLKHADIYLAGTRRGCPKPPGQLVHVVEREGVGLLKVTRLAQPTE